MVRKVRVRFWVELGLAITTAVLLALTLASREWIEEIFGVEPDAGSGALEWGLVAGLAVATVLFSVMARSEWRRRPALTGR